MYNHFFSSVVCLQLGFAFSLVIAPAPQGIALQSKEVTQTTILDAWSARRSRIKTAKIKWIETRTDIKGSYPSFGPTQSVIPPADHTFDGNCEAFVSDVRSHFSYDGKAWGLRAGKYQAYSRTVAFDGLENRSFNPTSETVNYPRGSILAGKQSYEVTTPHFRPIVWWLRPLECAMSHMSPEDLEYRGKRGIVSGVECHIMRFAKPGADSWELWIDPTKDFNIVRARRENGEEQFEWVFRLDAATSEWLPTSWTFTRSQAGSVQRHLSCKTTQCALNPPIDDKVFTITFPEGTWVKDAKTAKEYIVRAAGPPRPVETLRDIGKSYEELVQSDPNDTSGGYWWYVLLGCLICFAVVGAVYLARRKLSLFS
jgi:hypothetical protein